MCQSMILFWKLLICSTVRKVGSAGVEPPSWRNPVGGPTTTQDPSLVLTPGVPFWGGERRISPLEGMPTHKNSPHPKRVNMCLKYFTHTLIIIYLKIRRTFRSFAGTSNTKGNPCDVGVEIIRLLKNFNTTKVLLFRGCVPKIMSFAYKLAK